MFLNKKGDWSTLKNMILILLVGVIIFSIINMISKEGSRGADIASCRNWAVLQSAIKDPALGIPIKELNNPCVTFKDELKGNEFESYEILARSMHDVWKMYGSGEINFLSDKDFLGGLNSDIYCFIGDEINFKESKKIDINKFEEYLSNNYPPKSELTYSEIFMKAKDVSINFGDEDSENEEDNIMDIDSSEKLYIVYAVEKKSPDDFKGIIKNIGEGVLFSTIGLTEIGRLSPTTKKGFNKKIFTGRLKAGRDPISGRFTRVPMLKKVGTKALTKLSTVGLILGVVETAGYVASDQSVMIPSILMIKGKDINDIGCEAGMHYNPK